MVTEISDGFTGTGIPTDEPMIDSVGDRGIVLANGDDLQDCPNSGPGYHRMRYTSGFL